MKQLPKELFVKIDGDGKDQYYNATDDQVGLVEMGETAKIGTYRLVSTHTAKGVAITNNLKKVR